MAGQIEPEPERARAAPRRRLAAAAALAGIVAGLAVAFLLTRGESEAQAVLGDFLAAYESRDYEAAAALTCCAQRRDVAAALEANVIGLDGARLDAEVVEFEEGEGTAEATVRMDWRVPGIGEFAYENDEVKLERNDGDEASWTVSWSEEVVHQALDSKGSRLGTLREFPERAPILDREGSKLVLPRPVVEIGIVAGDLSEAEVEAAVEAIAAATEADPEALRASLAAAPSPDNFVPAITLRAVEFARVKDELDPVSGIEFGQRELPLAPTKEFARALLGTVGPITAEQLERLGGPYAVGDNVGQSGLQLAYEERLAGVPDRAVITRLADGSPVDTLLEVDGKRGKPLRTTLDGAVQVAAEETLGNSRDVSALVAVEASTGDVLAAATRPVDDAFNRAFEGQYPPGSTFKVVTTQALLEAGLDPDETVDCPPTIVAGGREFRNFEGGAAGAVPFRTDFAESCNTAFISLADRLDRDSLSAAGRLFGLGRDYELGVPAFAGDVPPARDETELAASMIGQGRILASPVAMAGVAATVAAGRWYQPRILARDPRSSGPRLPADQLGELRSLMRDVVTEGTGAALADVPGGPIGKSGTAEYGGGDPPPTHAWFIAARGEIAVAALVEDKPAGGAFAAPVVAEFLSRLGA